MSLKRIIKDYRTASPALIEKVHELYPEGVPGDQLITFVNGKGETHKAVEVHMPDAVYLIKMNLQLQNRLEEITEDIASTAEVGIKPNPLDEQEFL